MPNRPRSRGQLENVDDDDLACPGEILEEDEQLRLEVNIDREMFTRYLACCRVSPGFVAHVCSCFLLAAT